MLHSPNSAIQFSTLVLQQGASIVSHEVVEQNAKKSGHLDPRHIQNIPIGRNRSSSRLNPNQISPPETRQVISHLTIQTSGEPHHTMPIGRLLSPSQLFQPSRIAKETSPKVISSILRPNLMVFSLHSTPSTRNLSQDSIL